MLSRSFYILYTNTYANIYRALNAIQVCFGTSSAVVLLKMSRKQAHIALQVHYVLCTHAHAVYVVYMHYAVIVLEPALYKLQWHQCGILNVIQNCLYSCFLFIYRRLNIHFLHITPSGEFENKTVLPILLLHGWPGSIREFYELIPMLTTPNDESQFVFEVIVPSLPGFGWSEGARRPGFGVLEMSVVLRNLMIRLGHEKFYIQGGDWGKLRLNSFASVTSKYDHRLSRHRLTIGKCHSHPVSRKRNRISQQYVCIADITVIDERFCGQFVSNAIYLR